MTNPVNLSNQLSQRVILPNAPPAYDQLNEQKTRLAIKALLERISQQNAARGGNSQVTVQVTQVTGSPGTAGVDYTFTVSATDPAGHICQVALIALSGSGVFLTSGPALGVLSVSGQQWQVSLPVPGAGPGAMVVRGQADDGRFTDISVSLPEATLLAQPSSTIEFAPINGNTAKQAQVNISISCPLGSSSFKWLESRSSQPTAASVIASGTVQNLNIDTNNAVLTNVDTATLGDTVYFTAVPYTGAGATGTQLPVVELSATFSVWGKQKTAFYQRTQWKDATLQGYNTNSTDDIVNVLLPSGTIRDVFRINTVIPVGAQLVTASLTCFWNNATNQLGGFTFAIDANGGTVNFGNATHPANPQTVTVGLSNTLITGGFVVLRAQWGAPFANADAGQAGLQDVQITYVSPTQDVTP